MLTVNVNVTTALTSYLYTTMADQFTDSQFTSRIGFIQKFLSKNSIPNKFHRHLGIRLDLRVDLDYRRMS